MSNANEPPPDEIHSLEPKFILGLTAGSSKNCFFLNDKKILYHVSGVIVVHDLSNNSQEMLSMNGPLKTITTMELNNSKNLLAVVEMGKRPTISIYDLVKFKHKRRLMAPLEMKSNSFIKIQFTWDSLYLAALTDEPDYTMYYYNWKLSKVESHVRVIHPPTVVGPVSDMALNPNINGVCCFVGKGLFRLMKLGELVWKQYGFHKATKYEFTSVCWLNENIILACTADGRLFLVDNGELKAVYNVSTLTDFDLQKTMKNPLETKPAVGDPDLKIGLCLPVKRGLMLVVNNYHVYYYNMTTNWRYTKYSVFLIERDELLESIDEDPELHVINTLAVNPENKIMVCVTKRNQLFWSKIRWKSEHEEVPIRPFGETLHHGGVSGMSVCAWKPVFMTCGKSDRTVRLWNYENRSLLLLSADYPEDVADVSLHPTGLYAVVATAGRATFCAVCADALRPQRTFDLPGCRLARFSDAGHAFAVAFDGGNVRAYSSITFRTLFDLAGDVRTTITDLSWAANDLKLYTCDDEGRIRQFDVYTGEREFEISNEIVSSMAVSKDLKKFYVALQDGTLKEMNNQTVRNINLDHGPLNAIILSRSNSMLFVACQSGVILSLKFPMKSDVKYKEFSMHNSAVTKMRLTIDDATLISCSEDGVICIWDVKKLDEKLTIHLQKNFVDNMLIPSKILKHNSNNIVALNLKLNKLRNQFADDQVKLAGAHEKHLKQLIDQHSMNVKQLEKKIKEMVAIHDDKIINLKNKIDDVKTEHEVNLKMLKDNYENMLINEDRKYEKLKKEMLNTDGDLNNERKILVLMHNKKLQELAKQFDKNLKEKEDIIQKCKEQMNVEKNQMTIEIDKFDDQGEREMLELDISFASKFQKLSVKIDIAQKEAQQFQLKANTLMKREADVTYLVDKYQNDIKELEIAEKKFEEKIIEKNDKVTKWNEIIQKKDDEMNNKKSEIKNMEIQKLVLQYNKEEQEKVIEPLRNTVRNMEITIQEMKKQLWNTDDAVKHLTLDCVKCQETTRSTTKEIQKCRNTALNQSTYIKNIIIDFHFGFLNTTNTEKLKDIVRDMYNKNFANANLSSNPDVKSNMLREKEFLERMKANIYSQKKAAVMKKPMYMRAMEKNKMLIEKINSLKKELGINRAKYRGTSMLKNQRKKLRMGPYFKKTSRLYYQLPSRQ